MHSMFENVANAHKIYNVSKMSSFEKGERFKNDYLRADVQ